MPIAGKKQCRPTPVQKTHTPFRTKLYQDNEWNECVGFDVNSNDDPAKAKWREMFADENSPFHSFSRDFPHVSAGYPAMPTLERQEANPENFFFKHNDVAFLGLNEVNSYYQPVWVGQDAQNSDWVKSNFGTNAGGTLDCSFSSIVIFSQISIGGGIETAIFDYFSQCGGDKPTLNIVGDIHPFVFCSNWVNNDRIIKVTVEAFKAAPLLVSILKDPSDNKHYFHMESTSTSTTYGDCATFP